MIPNSTAHGRPASSALEQFLRRVVREHKTTAKRFKPKAVHDLRVALRRCRSLAEVYSALDLHHVWKQLDKVCKKQQRGLADLRDFQVMDHWMRKLRLTSNGAGVALASALKSDERHARRKAQNSLAAFPHRRWKKWVRRLPERAELIPVGDRHLGAVALERLNAARQVERRWRTNPSTAAWHDLRIATKRFRYTVEGFLPQQDRTWRPRLKRVLNALGEARDLDILRAWILQAVHDELLPAARAKQWMARVDRERHEREKRYERAVALHSSLQSSLKSTGRKAALTTRGGRSIGKGSRNVIGRSGKNSAAQPRLVWDRWRRKLEDLALGPQ